MGNKSATEKIYKEIKNRYNSTFDKTYGDAKEATCFLKDKNEGVIS